MMSDWVIDPPEWEEFYGWSFAIDHTEGADSDNPLGQMKVVVIDEFSGGDGFPDVREDRKKAQQRLAYQLLTFLNNLPEEES